MADRAGSSAVRSFSATAQRGPQTRNVASPSSFFKAQSTPCAEHNFQLFKIKIAIIEGCCGCYPISHRQAPAASAAGTLTGTNFGTKPVSRATGTSGTAGCEGLSQARQSALSRKQAALFACPVLFERLLRIGAPEAVLLDIAVEALAGDTAPLPVTALQAAQHIGRKLSNYRGLLIGFGVKRHRALF
jgi:hypothetical protein